MSINEFKNIKLLYVEDESDVRKYAMSYFKRIFSQVFEAEDAKNALEIFIKERPQIIITDIKMGTVSGIDLIKRIRSQDKSCQIIVLSAFLNTKYLLEAISLNLVKYLSKPIKHDELYLALLECSKNLKAQNMDIIYFSNDCYFNYQEKLLIKLDEIIKLTQKELELIELLTQNTNRTISYEEIENRIWYDSVMTDNALRLLVKKIRKKLPLGTLENIARIGYKIKTVSF